jgi:hypothetical protein
MFKPMRAYVSARGRAQLVEALLAMQAALWTLRFGGWVAVALAPTSDLGRVLVRGAALSSPFVTVLLAVTVVAFAAWLARATANVPALTGERLPSLPVMLAVVTPGVNLILTPHLLWRVWQASDPTPPPARRARRISLALWGPLFVALLVAHWGLPRPWAPLAREAWLLQVQALAATVAALACVALVRDVQRRQDEQWLDGERRRALPRPAPDALR